MKFNILDGGQLNFNWFIGSATAVDSTTMPRASLSPPDALPLPSLSGLDARPPLPACREGSLQIHYQCKNHLTQAQSDDWGDDHVST